jgi:hypothetical protein
MTVGAHISDEKKVKIAKDLLTGMSIIAVAAKHGSARSTVRRVLAEIGIPVPPRGDWRDTVKDFVAVKHSQTFDAEGNVKAESVAFKAPPGPVFEVPSGHTVKGVSALTDPEGRILAQWTKTREDGRSTQDLIKALQEAFAAYEGLGALPEFEGTPESQSLTLYPLPDLHLGMMSWGAETGENYDLKIAETSIRQGMDRLIAASPSSEIAVVLGLGDLFHQNDQSNRTPRSGHQLDVDGRFPKVLRAGVNLMMHIIGRAAQKHPRVIVRILPGNHDPESSLALSVALSVFYAGNIRITIDDSPSPHWYMRHGKVLLAGTHGHTLKPPAMAMLLATDRPSDWGASVYRHMMFGHVHHESAKEIGGVRVESFSSPAAKDAYATAGGYRSGRALNAVTYHSEHGEISRNRVNITGA